MEKLFQLPIFIILNPYASITKGEKGEELVDFEEMTEYFEMLNDSTEGEPGAADGIMLAGFSDDGTGVEDNGSQGKQKSVVRYCLAVTVVIYQINRVIEAVCESFACSGKPLYQMTQVC